MSTDLEQQLRTAFTEATSTLPTTPDPGARTNRAVARSRTGRRAAFGSALVALLLVAVVTGTSLRGTDRRVAPPAESQSTGPVVTSSDITTWPTRGNLAGKPIVEQARERLDDEMTISSIPFAGTVGGVDMVVAVGQRSEEPNKGRNALVLLHGSHGSPVSGWYLGEWLSRDGIPGAPAEGPPILPIGVWDEQRTLHLAVLAPSDGASAAYSPSATFDAEARASRRYQALKMENGIGTATFSAPSMESIALRTTWGGKTDIGGVDRVSDGGAGAVRVGAGEDVGEPRDDLFSAFTDPACRNLVPELGLQYQIGESLRSLGLRYDDVQSIKPLWCRERPVDGEKPGYRAGVAAMTLTDGTAFQIFHQQDFTEDGSGGSGGRKQRVPADRLMTRAWMFAFGAGVAPDVTISAPGASRVDVVTTEPDVEVLFSGRPDADGYLALSGEQARPIKKAVGDDGANERGLQIVTYDEQGQVIETVPYAELDAGDYVDGPVAPAP